MYSAKFRARAALDAIRGETTIALVAEKYGVHPVMVSRWKKQILDAAEFIFTPAFISYQKQAPVDVSSGEERFDDLDSLLVDTAEDQVIESVEEPALVNSKKERVLRKKDVASSDCKESSMDSIGYEQLGRLVVENAYLKKRITSQVE